MALLTNLKKAGQIMWQHAPRLSLVMLLDGTFFILLGIVTAPLYAQILTNIQAIFAVLGKRSPEIVQAAAQGGSSFSLPGTEVYMKKLLLLYLVLLLAMYVLYTILQGVSWKRTADIFTRKTFSAYMLPFLKFNVLWVSLFGLYHLFTLYLSFKVMLAARGAPYPIILVAIRYSVVAVFGYFILVSYALIPFRQRFSEVMRIAWSNALNFLPVYATVWASLLLIHVILQGAFSVNDQTGLIVGILLVLPWMTFVRVLLLQKCHTLYTKHK